MRIELLLKGHIFTGLSTKKYFSYPQNYPQ